MTYDAYRDHELYKRVEALEDTQGELMALIDDITAQWDSIKAEVTATIAALQQQNATLSAEAADPTKVASLQSDMSNFAATVASANPTPAPAPAPMPLPAG